MIGRRVGPYRIVAELGKGGMGTVWRAEVVTPVAGLEPGAVVALKIAHAELLREPGFFKRVLKEGAVGKKIRHPNVVATFDLDCIVEGDETLLYLAMEYVEGQTLRALFEELGPAPEALCCRIARDVSMGLEAIHAHGIVHRDVKPENIIVSRDQVVKVMDLGVARDTHDDVRLSRVGAFVGSILYAAPEQFRSARDELDARTDLYALGVVLFELASGAHPHDREDDSPERLVLRILNEPPRRISDVNPNVSPFFEELVSALLAKDRDERFASAKALTEALTGREGSAWWRQRAAAAGNEPRLPARRVRAAGETPLFGRDEEMRLLNTAWQRARGGDAQIVVIEGAAGIGKTRLLDEFVAAAEGEGAGVATLVADARIRCAGDASAFIPALRTFLDGGDADIALRPLLARTPAIVPALAALIRGEPPPQDAAPLTPELVESAVVQVVRSLGESRAVVVCYEDLHLAPEDDRALFAALAASIRGTSVMLAGTTRAGSADVWESGDPRAAVGQRLALAPLGTADLTRILAAATGSERTAAELAPKLLEKCAGSPLLVLESLRDLKAEGVLVRDGSSAWGAAETLGEVVIPSSIGELLWARIARLDAEDRELHQVAACFGYEFDPHLVADATNGKHVAVLKRLAMLEQHQGLVRSLGNRSLFTYPEVREVLLAGMSAPLRRRMHGALAAALESRSAVTGTPEVVGLVEQHLSAGSGQHALRYADAALEQLDRSNATDSAAGLASRLISAPGLVLGEDRMRLLARQGDRLSLLSRPEDARVVFDEARRLADESGEVRWRAQARVGAARCCRDLAHYDEARALLDEALAIAESGRERCAAADAHDGLGDVELELGRLDEASVHYEQQAVLRREEGDVPLETAALGKLGEALHRLGRFPEAYERFRRERKLARSTDSRLGRAVAERHLGTSFYALGHYDDARRLFDRSRRMSRSLGYRRGEAAALVELGRTLLLMGDADAASRRLHAAVRLCQDTGLRHLEGAALHALACVAATSSDAAKAFRLARRSERLRRSIGDRAGRVESLLLLGRLRKLAGLAEFARSAFERAALLAATLGMPGEAALGSAHLAALPGGDVHRALDALREHERRLSVGDRMEARLMMWQATADIVHLRATRALLDHVVRQTPAERQDAVIMNVPLHRNVFGAAAILPAADAPAA